MALAVACSKSSSSPTTPTPPPVADNPTQTPPETPPSQPPPNTPPPTQPPPPPSGQTGRLIALGDIGWCGSPAVGETARLIEGMQGDVVLAGDLAYMNGSPQDFARCFDPAFGRFRNRWRPTPGNHEYGTPGAAGYFQYFAESRSYYAFRAGDWLVLMLNSSEPSGVGRGSAQYEFVRTELQRHRYPCAMAVWHHPLFSSGPNGTNPFMRDMWALLYEHDADVVVAAHDHFYERFGKQDVDGRSDARGLRQFIVGTGGANLYDFMRMSPNSQAREKTHGVLRLTLNYSDYNWQFVDTFGRILDQSADACH